MVSGSRLAKRTSNVYLLPLTDEGAPDVPGGYISLPPPTTPPYHVRFSIGGTSSVCRQGSLWVNFPDAGEQFEREKFKEYKLHPDFSRDIEISIPILAAGVFAFYITYSSLPVFSHKEVEQPKENRTPTYYVDVHPTLTIRDEVIPLNALSIYSVLAKFVGEYPKDWTNHLESLQARNYNMVHFAPLMVRGESNSPYSIYDQLKFDPACFPHGERDILDLMKLMERRYALLALTDVVWNHTANNSGWLEEHPDAGYNIETAPWLESAFDLDTALLMFGDKLESHGLPVDPKSEEDLQRIIDGVKNVVVEDIRLWEFYVIDVNQNARDITKAWLDGSTFPDLSEETPPNSAKGWVVSQQADLLLRGLDDTFGRRHQRHVDPKVGALLINATYGPYDPTVSGQPEKVSVLEILVEALKVVNVRLYDEFESDRAKMLANLKDRLTYLHLADHGPKRGAISAKSPLIETYFTRLPLNATTQKHDSRALALVNNGWIWNGDALTDHAGPVKHRPYLIREVIVWSDCVKLRYGSGPEESPFLWEHMSKYTRLMAKYFSGFRIDNCHATPMHVAEYLLNEARTVRPNLLVCAELFTGDENMDYVFVKRLGINCLIREAMNAWDPAELSRLVHKHGGRPIGSFEISEVTASSQASTADETGDHTWGRRARKTNVHRIKQTPVHALFMDCTHDNEVPAQKRQARDTLPNGALVAMCASAVGSVMGYDEIYPRLVNLVTETRRYSSTAPGSAGIGIQNVKALLNGMHTLMGEDGYEETFIHHENEYITIHRVHPISRRGYFLIAHTAFPGSGDGNGDFKEVHLGGTKAHQMRSYMLEVDASDETKERVANDKSLLRGLPSSLTRIDEAIKVDVFEDETVISITGKFPPGSVAFFETWIPSGTEHTEDIDAFVKSGAKGALESVDLIDLNFILYRCDAEERDSSDGQDGVYNIPNHGPLVYAGLQGWWSVLVGIIRRNDLGHPLCQHLREGRWALDYILGRIQRISSERDSMAPVAVWLQERFEAIGKLPSFLLPRYFALTVQTAYAAAWDRGVELMGSGIKNGQWFLQSLAMVSVQQMGIVKSASLYPKKVVPSLAAGLPHFATSWARCWGRDVFISLRGLFLATGRFAEAKDHIVAFASVLKHGMIPNLLGSGVAPRYNSRDSIWFFLQAIQDYTKIVPDGSAILREKISRRFLPWEDTYFEADDPRAYSKQSTLLEIVHEAMQRHATGLDFREANAGPKLDMQMKSEGFDIKVSVDWQTGLIFGGNQDNCGTWMDKMGESEKAGSKGVPGTPRDGAAVEITGLLYSTLVWLAQRHKDSKEEVKGVATGNPAEKVADISYEQWADLIKHNFEKCYYVPLSPKEDADYDVNPSVINRRGIYKDLYKSGKEYEDYQLRPNFPIAMCVAPQLFDPEHARHALFIADDVLRGPTGMATLDPGDLKYRPFYDNSADTDDFETSKGRNYHQGPEWLWPTGYFLRAMLRFDLMRRTTKEGRVESLQQITQRLKGCKQAIVDNPWAGLAELTNKDGAYCADSSPTQAWSAGCLIDLFQDAAELALDTK